MKTSNNKIQNHMLAQIGNTPLIRLHGMENSSGAAIWGKLESANPGGSIKDRIALGMITQAEADGLISPGDRLIEPTSGNTGIGLALVGAIKGYPVTIVMPDSMSIERRQLLQAYGAKLVLTPAQDGINAAISTAKELSEHGNCQNSGGYMLQQFDNPANPATHAQTTAPEIYHQRHGEIDAFVTSVGTGGTLTGVGSYLRQQLADIKIYAVEPATSAVLSGKPAGKHAIQGIGAGFIPPVLDTAIYHQVITVSDQQAINTCVNLAKQGIFCGISSGANVCAAQQIALKLGPDKHVVTILCDSGERYLSTGIFNQ